MRALMITVGTLIFAAGFVAGGRLQPPVGAKGFTVLMDCGTSSAAQVTVWEAEGQWRTPNGNLDHEQSKVLLLVHRDTAVARQSVLAVIEAYRKTFEQQSVLWENARVCVAA